MLTRMERLLLSQNHGANCDIRDNKIRDVSLQKSQESISYLYSIHASPPHIHPCLNFIVNKRTCLSQSRFSQVYDVAHNGGFYCFAHKVKK